MSVYLLYGEVDDELPRPVNALGPVKADTAEAAPLRTALARREEDGMRVFTWTTSTPALHAQYRLEWRFGARPDLNTTLGESR
ncbi:hypothetical protein [Streptomyces sp. NPDC048462]|uniref:hypothetical protein n=1 Tax=Streptomyces sp. NPDC048462 TaxID=3365555 RepID=UPI003713054C